MANPTGMARTTIKYGYVFGPRLMVGPYKVGASEVFTDTGGKFVWFDTSRYIEVADSGNNPDSTTLIWGWAECGAFTASSTDGATTVAVDVSPFSVYYIPADATVDITMRGKACDLIVDSNRQRADVGESNEDYLIILDVDIANTAVYVRMNEATQYKVT